MLSKSNTRAVYDQFGEEGLKSGVPTTDIVGGFSGGYVFHGNPDKVFREFFGGDNPFNEFFEPPKDPDMAIGMYVPVGGKIIKFAFLMCALGLENFYHSIYEIII